MFSRVALVILVLSFTFILAFEQYLAVNKFEVVTLEKWYQGRNFTLPEKKHHLFCAKMCSRSTNILLLFKNIYKNIKKIIKICFRYRYICYEIDLAQNFCKIGLCSWNETGTKLVRYHGRGLKFFANF